MVYILDQVSAYPWTTHVLTNMKYCCPYDLLTFFYTSLLSLGKEEIPAYN